MALRLYPCVASACLAVLVGGCQNPYALKAARLNYDATTTGATIEISDPKLYRREALINERRDETAYLDGLLAHSASVEFKPEIMRDLEFISGFSAAAGMSSDPAAKSNYENARETGAIQQQISTLKLQLQLEQLQRDAQLMRDGFAKQTEPSGNAPGNGNGASPPSASSVPSPASPDQLANAIKDLQSHVANWMNENNGLAHPGSTQANPSDLFRDREAYRDLLKSACNATSLDELHDKDGAALIRLSFQATVFPPDKKYADTLGMIRMQVKAPDWAADPDAIELVYATWLSYVNHVLNAPMNNGLAKGEPAAFRENPAVGTLSGVMFEKVYYYYPKAGEKNCAGLSLDPRPADTTCGRLVFAIPQIQAPPGSPNGQFLSIGDYYRGASADEKAQTINSLQIQLVKSRYNLIASGASSFGGNPCDITGQTQGKAGELADSLKYAQTVSFAAENLVEVDRQARKFLTDHDLSSSTDSSTLTTFTSQAEPAQQLLLSAEQYLRGCPMGSPLVARAYIPDAFRRVVQGKNLRVAIYNVSPRERVQEMSTVARASDAVALAAAISKSIPSSGTNAQAALSYARSASGKVDAFERVPLVVSFAEAQETPADQKSKSDAAFGWLMGPSVSVNASGKSLELEHRIRPYDLSVDLSAPGWWPYLNLNVETGWAPNWRTNPGTIVATDAPPRTIRVMLSLNSADMEALTALLTHSSGVRLASITSTEPATLPPCGGIALQIVGENIWRTSSVTLGGEYINHGIDVMPDMRGVIVTIPPGAYPIIEKVAADYFVRLTALTPYDHANWKLKMTAPNANGNCEKTAVQEE